ncbi:MAG TPA: BamA/TamA family outer membrane protein [Chitinophagaceae bacterium]
MLRIMHPFMNYSTHAFKKINLFFFSVAWLLHAAAQKQKISLKDSLDGAFDLSDYIINAHGFVPVPVIITEPALGGFGGGIVPVFIKKRPPYIDTVRGSVKVTPIAPDITGVMGLYTLNNSWMAAVFRSGTFIKSRIKYMFGGNYGDINMSYYRTVPNLGEKKFTFSIKTAGGLVQAIKRIGISNWYGGLKYLFLKTDVDYTGDRLLPPDFVKPIEYASIVSQLGAVIELDNRDNVFTPNKGMKVHVDAQLSDNIFGSDYDYWRMNYYMYAYKPISQKLTGGWRLDGQQAFSEPPFFMLPFIDMRGIPANRYQGNADILTELEFRWDLIRRWSLVLFGGTGKAFDKWNEFSSADLVYSYGTGFRYLVARSLN